MAIVREFPADPRSLTEVRRFIGERAARDSFSEHEPDLLLAVSEAATNAIKHSGSSRFEVAWTAVDDHAEIEVRDGGVFKPKIPMPSLEEAGRGIPLMTAVTQEFTLAPGTRADPGTVVRLVIRKAVARVN
jgi:anti-sigma regulatory factor (Ser/Thr protein kinase)